MKSSSRFRQLRRVETEQHPVDVKVDGLPAIRRLHKKLAQRSAAIVRALGTDSTLWFQYEEAINEMIACRDEAYFDAGVQYGAADSATNALGKPSSLLARQLIQEALRSGAAPDEAAAASLMAAWALLSRARRSR